MVQRTKRKRVSVILTPLENYTHFYWKGGGMTLEVVIRLLLVTELDRAEKEREITVKRIKDGIKASSKKSGRKEGQLDKMTPELEADIRKFLTDRSIKQIDLMNKYNISRNTLKKYIEYIANKKCI